MCGLSANKHEIYGVPLFKNTKFDKVCRSMIFMLARMIADVQKKTIKKGGILDFFATKKRDFIRLVPRLYE